MNWIYWIEIILIILLTTLIVIIDVYLFRYFVYPRARGI